MDETKITCPTRGLFVDLERDHRLLIELAESDGRDPVLELANFLLVPVCKRELGVAA
jgi:hypothetical protein